MNEHTPHRKSGNHGREELRFRSATRSAPPRPGFVPRRVMFSGVGSSILTTSPESRSDHHG
jgi:hypothetical protein